MPKWGPNTRLTSQQLARYLGVSASHVGTLRRTGQGPTFQQLGRIYRYTFADVQAWEKAQIAQVVVGPTPAPVEHRIDLHPQTWKAWYDAHEARKRANGVTHIELSKTERLVRDGLVITAILDWIGATSGGLSKPELHLKMKRLGCPYITRPPETVRRGVQGDGQDLYIFLNKMVDKGLLRKHAGRPQKFLLPDQVAALPVQQVLFP